MRPTLNDHLRRIVVIDRELQAPVIHINTVRTLRAERSSLVAAIQNAPRGNTQ